GILEGAGAAAGQPEARAASAVRAQLEPEKALLRGRFEDDCACAVTEEDECRTVAPVEDLGEHVPADDERPLREAAGEHPVALRERVHEARAAGRKVVGGRVLGTKLVGEER